MSTGLLSFGIALLAGVGLVVSVGVFSLASGAFFFLFMRPKVLLLKSKGGEGTFSFAFKWDSAREPAKFDAIKVRLFNPFSSPSQVEVYKEFDGATSNFAKEIDFGPGYEKLISALKSSKPGEASVTIELLASRQSISHAQQMKAEKFLLELKEAKQTADEFNEKNKVEKKKPLFTTTQRSFVADPLPPSNRALKIASNPEFQGGFATEDSGGEKEENYAVSKVWIEPGCIVCDACEAIYPEVFEVTDDSCIIRPDAPLDNGILINEAAEACPVEVIKFNKAS